MASSSRELPVRPKSLEHGSTSISGHLHQLDTGESVTQQYQDNSEQSGMIDQATLMRAGLCLHEVKQEPMNVLDLEEPRRSSRKRKTKSALELLGITPKKEKTHKSSEVTTRSDVVPKSQADTKTKQDCAAPAKVVSRGRGRPRKKNPPPSKMKMIIEITPRTQIGSGDIAEGVIDREKLPENEVRNGCLASGEGENEAAVKATTLPDEPVDNDKGIETISSDSAQDNDKRVETISNDSAQDNDKRVETNTIEATQVFAVPATTVVESVIAETTSPETYQLTELLIQFASAGNNLVAVKDIGDEVTDITAAGTVQDIVFNGQSEIADKDFTRETFVLIEAAEMPENDGSSADQSQAVILVKGEEDMQEDTADVEVDGATMAARLLRVPRPPPSSTPCTPVTSNDLDNPARSLSGKRVKPMRQVIMTQSLQDMVDDMQPVDSMANHVIVNEMSHGARKHFMCKHCEKPLLDRHDFRRHIKKHPEVDYKPFVCPICGYRAQIRAQIARHINIHSDIKPYTCTECGKGFNFKQKLQLHMKYHRDVRDEQCPLCEKAFHEHKTLKTHLLKIHNVDNMRELMKNLADQPSPSDADEPTEIVLPPAMAAQLNLVEASDAPTDTCDQLTETCQENAPSATDDAEVDGDAQEIRDASRQIADADGDTREIRNASQQITEVNGDTSDASRQITSVGDDASLSERDMEHLGLSEGSVGRVGGARERKRGAPRRSVLYGTRKTNINTSRFKMGLLPIQHSEPQSKKAAVFDPVTGKRKRFVNNQRVVSEEQVEPDLLVYCEVDNHTTASKVLFHCRLCQDKVFPSKTQFATHLEGEHPDIRAWKCSLCDYRCRLRTSLFVHERVHSGIRDHICNVCGKGFLFRQKLKMHLKVHLNLREHQCLECSKCFNDKTDLKKHFRRVHIADRPYVCELCQKAYKDNLQLKRHIESHSATKNHLCEHCNKYYRSKLSLAQHMKSHTCMFHCEICDKNFGSYSGFMAHKVMHDESYEGYVCEICSRVLHTKGSLCRHRLVSHSNERPFACSDCPKNFKTKKDLKNHKYCHVTEKEFACEICEYQCKRMDSLRVHMRRHAPVKPFQCELCGRQYTQKHALEVHMRHHSGVTVAECHICQRTFTTKYQLSVHIRRVHGAQEAFKHGMHEVSLVAPSVGGDQPPPGGEQASSFTVFMCEECNSVFLTQDSLAVHILAEHMRHGWVEGGVGGGVSITDAPDAVIEVTTTTAEKMYVGDDGGTIETFVSINDPSSSRDKIVSLLQPLVDKTLKVVEGGEVVEGEIAEENVVEENFVGKNFVGENNVEENNVEENKPELGEYFILDNSPADAVKDSVDGVVLEVRESCDSDGYVIVPSALETLLAATELHQNETGEECVAVAQTIEIPVTTTEGDTVTEG